jgi:sodium/potassium-transporting ATPase subunit alpha
MVGGFQLLLLTGSVLCWIAFAIEDNRPGKLPIGERLDNIFLGAILFLVVLISGIFSYFQNKKSSDIMKKFATMVPKMCQVTRNGEPQQMNPAELVVGDLVEVKNGDKVPADIRVVNATAMKVDNASLTGESEPQKRSSEAQPELSRAMEASSLAFFTTNVVNGRAAGIVIRVGDQTVIGQIQALVTNTENVETPIAKEIHHFIVYIGSIAVALGVLFFIIDIARGASRGTISESWIDSVILLIGIIVANVPEGLLVTVTVCLTLASVSMQKKFVLVKNLESVETLGSTSCICSDKTGTLTQNRMTVAHLFFDGAVGRVSEEMKSGIFEFEHDSVGSGLVDANSVSVQALWKATALCNTATYQWDDGVTEEEKKETPYLDRICIGDATSSGILKWTDTFAATSEAQASEFAYTESLAYRASAAKVLDIPFNSTEKISASVHNDGSDSLKFYLKGAPERVITRCSHIMVNGEAVPMTDEHRDRFQKGYEGLGGQGERVLGFATETLSPSEFPLDFVFEEDVPYNGLTARNTLTFVGLTALIDPPRPAVPQSVADCQSGGIQVIMVTGDHQITAKAIAKNIGIIVGDTAEDVAAKQGIDFDSLSKEEQWKMHDEAPAQVVNGETLKTYSDEDLARVLKHNEIVFARTSPQQKLQIVQGCQALGRIVAVTGDGVNDSPALKAADIGVAMGIAGSDVSKEAADLILMNDDFSSIVTGVKEGRLVFDNLKKSIAYTLTSNIPEIMPFLIATFVEIPLPLSTIMILAIDLGTDMAPAISMAYENAESDIMLRKPRDPKKDNLVTTRLLSYTYLQIGMIQACAGFFSYFVVMSDSGWYPGDLIAIRKDWDNKNIQAYPDSYGNEWAFSTRYRVMNAAQTAYFVSIVVVQWADLIICKTRVLSVFQQGMKNWPMNRALVFETLLAVFISYVPGMDSFFRTQPLNVQWWFPAFVFSLIIWLYDEKRKQLIRQHRANHDGKAGWVEDTTYY